jgi:hypothetical protein
VQIQLKSTKPQGFSGSTSFSSVILDVNITCKVETRNVRYIVLLEFAVDFAFRWDAIEMELPGILQKNMFFLVNIISDKCASPATCKDVVSIPKSSRNNKETWFDNSKKMRMRRIRSTMEGPFLNDSMGSFIFMVIGKANGSIMATNLARCIIVADKKAIKKRLVKMNWLCNYCTAAVPSN